MSIKNWRTDDFSNLTQKEKYTRNQAVVIDQLREFLSVMFEDEISKEPYPIVKAILQNDLEDREKEFDIMSAEIDNGLNKFEYEG